MAGKELFAIRPAEEGRFFLAGLYRFEPGEKLPRFTILTRDAAPEIAAIHPRMPVLLPGNLRGDWLSAKADARALLARAMLGTMTTRKAEKNGKDGKNAAAIQSLLLPPEKGSL